MVMPLIRVRRGADEATMRDDTVTKKKPKMTMSTPRRSRRQMYRKERKQEMMSASARLR